MNDHGTVQVFDLGEVIPTADAAEDAEADEVEADGKDNVLATETDRTTREGQTIAGRTLRGLG